MPRFNRTKLIATIGPASNTKETITQLIQAGVDVFRLNFSHGTHDEKGEIIRIVHEINEELGTHVGILADLQGPKIRLGDLANGKFKIKKGDKILLTTDAGLSSPKALHITYENFARDISAGDKILIDDGKLELKAISTNGINEVMAKVISGGTVKAKKGVNLPQTNISIEALTPKDMLDLNFILSQPVNWIALSFVRTPDELTKLKGIIHFRQHPAKVIAKVEKPEAVNNIDAIIRAADAIMVARGDLGVEMPLSKIPLIQKDIVFKCHQQAKPVIIATQIMENMIERPIPTRAEVTDVSNAIFEGADALMLSGETAIGEYPVKVVETIEKVITVMENEQIIYDRKHRANPDSDSFLSDALCYNACRIAEEVDAKAIIGMTKTGYNAFMLSSFRPQSNIFIFTESHNFLNAASLIWGVRALYFDGFNSTNESMKAVNNILKEKGLVESGDIVINIGILPLHEYGMSNTIKMSTIK